LQHRFCASGAYKQTSALNLHCASVNWLDKFLNRPGKLQSCPSGQALLVPGLALRLIKNFVSLQQDGQADVILSPRLTQSRGRWLQPLKSVKIIEFNKEKWTTT